MNGQEARDIANALLAGGWRHTDSTEELMDNFPELTEEDAEKILDALHALLWDWFCIPVKQAMSDFSTAWRVSKGADQDALGYIIREIEGIAPNVFGFHSRHLIGYSAADRLVCANIHIDAVAALPDVGYAIEEIVAQYDAALELLDLGDGEDDENECI